MTGLGRAGTSGVTARPKVITVTVSPHAPAPVTGTAAGPASGSAAVRALPASGTLTVTVSGRRKLTDRVTEFRLTSADGSPLPEWTPGSHIDLRIPVDSPPASPDTPDAGQTDQTGQTGRTRRTLVRQYSLCSDPADPSSYVVAVDRSADSRGGSAALHRYATPGTVLEISEPRNHFPLTRALNYVFIAGGVGVTPMVPLAAQAARSGRPWRMICLARTSGDMPYLQELQERHGGAVAFHASVEGRIDLAAALADLPRGTAVYVCGPGTLADDVAAAVEGQPAVDVFTEQFTAPVSTGVNTSFDVSLASTGETFTVPEDASVLSVLEAHGKLLASSCREGMCGTCEVSVVAGEIDHRDSVLTPEERAENESMMICVSRCRSGRLVLDL